ncbi:amylo-alpha-1,6-glucosidase [Nitrospira moscoviensis]|uniref:Putative Glycogen debranching enzyme n=1 Tax=Nitrospira moscoviensis TaxID=42253 RepID=A0A0K2G9A0_NITMO|nr:amylo-alpha-1,6-glucosidase [Nitrospira moscoviensis]ALA57429.1 putative Glycogen debranching enzyme [Nitrospira moscoviensis]
MKIAEPECQNLDHALSLEWLETNGRGGFASGTVAGANTRRYHALLLVARKPPSERIVLVNHLEEWLEIGEQAFPLTTNLYPGAIHPAGYIHCTSFELNPWPTWAYRIGGITVQREILCVRGRDLILLRWSLKGKTKKPIRLRLRPKLTGRDYHALHRENEVLKNEARVQKRGVEWQPYQDLPAVRAFHAGIYRHAPEWYRRIELPMERQRGLDYEEDWWSPGEFIADLSSATPAFLALTSEPMAPVDVDSLVRSEKARRRKVQAAIPTKDDLAQRLWLATEAYLCERGSGQTVVAGYPWFTDWGRDTFMSLPGLCLVTGRYDVARQIIESFAAHVSEGMIPNRFPDVGEQPEYNTIDASLWFIQAVDRYLAYSKDMHHVRKTAWPAVKHILDGYRTGTRYGIRMDHDGLITGGVPGANLTWMDAKVVDWVVTPRHGKPVEIQALWIRALEVGARLARRFREAELAERCAIDRRMAVTSFQRRFWYQAGGYLYDVVDGPEGDDPSLRPNQLYVLALCPDLLTKEQGEQVLRAVEDHLVTPVGLRTLSPKDERYRGRYNGAPAERDAAYHQGIVWPFLLGVFITAYMNVHGRTARHKAQARKFLVGLQRHLDDTCLGQVSELFEGEAPHEPRGCPAQAWSVAEPLRALIEDAGITKQAERSAGSVRAARRR